MCARLVAARRLLGVRGKTWHPAQRNFHFDKFVERLQEEGLGRERAEGIMTAMAEVIDESIRSMNQNMVTRTEQEKVHRLHICLSHILIMVVPSS
jgi:hypothetical protein